MYVLFCALDVPVDEHLMEASLNDCLDKSAVITANSLWVISASWLGEGMRIAYLDTLGVHLVILLWSRPVQSRITFLANEQVREVHLLELQLDWLDELLCHELSRFTA